MKKKKMTYAQVADKLTKKIGELEEKAKSSDRFARETAAQMLPRYQEKLDRLFAEQERVKQEEYNQDVQNFQMKWGGRTPQYGIGGDIAAGAVGLIGGALGTVPLVGDIAQNALYNLHGKLDKDLTDQEKSIRGYGQAAGALGAGALTGNIPGALGEAAEGVGTGINAGTNGRYANMVDPMVGLAGMAGNFMAYGGKLPMYPDGGRTPKGLDIETLTMKRERPDMFERIVEYRNMYKPDPRVAYRGSDDFEGWEQKSKNNISPYWKNYLEQDKDSPYDIPPPDDRMRTPYNWKLAYGGRLPKMQDGGMVGDPPYSVDNPPTYQEWLATRPDLRNDPGAVDIYHYDISSPSQMAKFDPNNVYRGNMGIQTDDYGNQYVQDYTPPMEESYGQAQTTISPKTTKGNPAYQPVQSDNYKDFTSTGELDPETGKYERPGDPNAGGKTYDAPWNAKSEPDQPGYEPEPLKPWQEALYRGAAYAPTIYNTIQGLRKPQELDHEDFQNPYEQKALNLMAGRRYNIDPQLQSNRSTLNNMRKNLAGAAGGHAGTYLSNLGNLQMNTDKMNEAAYAMKQNMDNQYMAEEAGMLGDLGAMRARTKLGIQDINDKNRAIKAAHMAKATEGLSNIAQNERYMQGMSQADRARIMALQAMPWDFIPQFNTQNQMTGFNYYDQTANQD